MPLNLDLELFISEVKKRPALYNTQLKDYSDRNLKQRLWVELCELFVENWHELVDSERANKGRELQCRWKNLRTCFKREYDTQKKESSGPAVKRRRKYMYFDQLLFLCNSVKNRNSSYSDVEPEETIIIQSETPPAALIKPTTTNIRKKKTTKREDKAEIDEDKYFLLSLLPTFRKFNEEQKFTARIEILKAMRRVRLTNSEPFSNFALKEEGSPSSPSPLQEVSEQSWEDGTSEVSCYSFEKINF